MTCRVWLRFQGHVFVAMIEHSDADEACLLARQMQRAFPSTVAMGVEVLENFNDFTGTAVLKESTPHE